MNVMPTNVRADPIRALVLDDEEDTRKSVRRILSRHGVQVETACNGREGLDVLMQSPFDVLVVDLKMHEMDGVAFLRVALEIWPWLGVVIITGFPEDDLIGQARQLGVHRILLKPTEVIERLAENVLEEADTQRRRLRAPSGLSLERYQDQLRILERLTRSALNAKTLVEALRRLCRELGQLLPCELVGILYAETDEAQGEEQGHMIMAVHEVAPQALVDQVRAEMLERYTIVSGKVLAPEQLPTQMEVIPRQEHDTPLAQKTFMVPFRMGVEEDHAGVDKQGILALVTDQAYTSEDLPFLYHLSPVFMELSRTQQLAIHDHLTGLYNRSYTEEALKEALAKSSEHHPVSVIIMDADRFKDINDTYGHMVGDEVLEELAQMLRRSAPPTSIIGRYGGEEFVLVLPEMALQESTELAERLLERTREHTFCDQSHPLRLTISVGVSATVSQRHGGVKSDELLNQADQALYMAKREGRDRARAWSEVAAEQYVQTARGLVKERIMVVDDEPAICEVIRRLLALDGFDVSAHRSADDALMELKSPESTYGLILTDINMPGKSGLELLEELRRADESIIKIVMTGQATVDNAVESLRHGAYDFIQKPISREQLTAVVNRAVEYRRLLRENRDYQLILEEMVREKSAQLTKSLEESKQSYEFTLEALVGMLDAREQDSGRHSVRVRELALVLGRHLGLSEEELQTLGQGALLHDIGKIAVGDAVLLKPGPLSPDERKGMERHPVIGHDILSRSSRLEHVAQVVRSHHEHYDGSGYPDGLSGQDICLGARIFAVVDAYDVMRAQRVYCESMPPEDARVELQSHSGTQFDPEIVAVFLECQPEMERVLTGLAGAETGLAPVAASADAQHSAQADTGAVGAAR